MSTNDNEYQVGTLEYEHKLLNDQYKSLEDSHTALNDMYIAARTQLVHAEKRLERYIREIDELRDQRYSTMNAGFLWYDMANDMYMKSGRSDYFNVAVAMRAFFHGVTYFELNRKG